MIEKESCVRSSRLIPLADDIYCLVFSASLTLSPPVTLLVMQFIKVENVKSQKIWTNSLSFFLCFLSLIAFLPLFNFTLFRCQFCCFALYEQKPKKMPCDNTRIFIMPLHTSKSTLDNCIVWFCLVWLQLLLLLFLIVFYVCTHKL